MYLIKISRLNNSLDLKIDKSPQLKRKIAPEQCGFVYIELLSYNMALF